MKWAAIMLLGAGLAGAFGWQEDRKKDYQVLDRRPGQGEQCLVCGNQIRGEEIVEIRYKGRIFHVSKDMLPQFAENPDRYFDKLQARSALFDERGAGLGQLSSAWLWLGIYVLAGLICGAACGYLAVSKNLSPLPWFFAGLLGNVAALAVAAAVPKGDCDSRPGGLPGGLRKVPATRSPRPCPECGNSLHPSAESCDDCGAEVEPLVSSETGAASKHA